MKKDWLGSRIYTYKLAGLAVPGGGNIMSPPAFRFNAKRIFLTYPRCDAERETVRDLLVSTLGCQYYCVARESHVDGGYHLHAYGEWTTPFSTRDVRLFDVGGCHPNIQPVRSTKRVLEYIRKSDSEALANVESLDGGRVHYGSILAEAEGGDDFLARVAERYPRDYVLCYERLEAFRRAKYPEARIEYVPRYTDFVHEPDGLREWKLSLEEEVGKYACRGGPSPLPPRSNILSCLLAR